MGKLVEYDELLMERFRQGEARAFQLVHSKFYRNLLWFAFSMIRNQDDAQDLVAEVFLKLWKRHTLFESLANVKAFLYITTRNDCLNYLRAAKQKGKVDSEYQTITDHHTDPLSRGIANAELLEEIFKRMEALPTNYRMLLKLHYQEGLTIAEIAQKLRMPEVNARMLKSRALRCLRDHLLKVNSTLLFLLFSLSIAAVM